MTKYNPQQDLFDQYITMRFDGESNERAFVVSLASVQRKLLESVAGTNPMIDMFLDLTKDDTICASLETQHAIARFASKQAH
jgi:hypothetical protein